MRYTSGSAALAPPSEPPATNGAFSKYPGFPFLAFHFFVDHSSGSETPPRVSPLQRALKYRSGWSSPDFRFRSASVIEKRIKPLPSVLAVSIRVLEKTLLESIRSTGRLLTGSNLLLVKFQISNLTKMSIFGKMTLTCAGRGLPASGAVDLVGIPTTVAPLPLVPSNRHSSCRT